MVFCGNSGFRIPWILNHQIYCSWQIYWKSNSKDWNCFGHTVVWHYLICHKAMNLIIRNSLNLEFGIRNFHKIPPKFLVEFWFLSAEYWAKAGISNQSTCRTIIWKKNQSPNHLHQPVWIYSKKLLVCTIWTIFQFERLGGAHLVWRPLALALNGVE